MMTLSADTNLEPAFLIPLIGKVYIWVAEILDQQINFYSELYPVTVGSGLNYIFPPQSLEKSIVFAFNRMHQHISSD